MAYIGWPTNVNKIILDSTTVTVGDGATVQDSLETGGQKKTRLARENSSDKYSVTMTFSFTEESKEGDPNGFTELDRFWVWYKWVHCYGTNPFRFPAILLNSNRQYGWATEEREHIANRQNNTEHREGSDILTADDIPDYEYYRITSAAEGSKSGTDCQITMTWETYATGPITVPDETAAVYAIEPVNGYIDVLLTSTPRTEPTDTTWELLIDDEPVTVTGMVFDGNVTARLFFDKLTDGQIHTAKILTFSKTFEGI